MRPYFLMAGLFAGLAVLAAMASGLTDVGLMSWFNGLRWLRVHFITLGLLTEIAFGLLPRFVAARADNPTPPVRWDIWFALNSGLLILLIGIPLINGALILTGGTLVFIAALLLGVQLYQLHPRVPQWNWKFYIAGVSYLLLGIFLGTGMWLGWGEWLQLGGIKEVHIHANVWGFASLVMAGLLIDAYPKFARRALAWPRSITPIFWMLVTGAFALVIGPWLVFHPLLVAGLVLHLVATIWLLLNVIVPLRGDALARTPGFWHLLLSYAWLFLPVLAGPFVVLQSEWFPVASVELNAPAGLVYMWLLQYLFALLPFLFTRAFFPQVEAKLGGRWASVLAMNLGGVFYWSSILLQGAQAELEACAYALWVVAFLIVLGEVWRGARTHLAEAGNDAAAPPRNSPAAESL